LHENRIYSQSRNTFIVLYLKYDRLEKPQKQLTKQQQQQQQQQQKTNKQKTRQNKTKSGF